MTFKSVFQKKLPPRPVSLVAACSAAIYLLIAGPIAPAGAEDIKMLFTYKFPKVQTFIAAKQTQAEELARNAGFKVPENFQQFFAAGAKGDWPTFTNLAANLPKSRRQGPEPDTTYYTLWAPALECILFFEVNRDLTPKYVEAIGRDMLDSIPAGSIYFGGTDIGRGIPTGLSKSHAKADPFFTLTQNALADNTYLNYLRTMYGSRIYIPTAEDSQGCFNEYLQDAQRRLKTHSLKPGEEVREEGGRVQVSGQVAVMAINGLLSKVIFEKNPAKEFYVEESFPLEWMYPHLTPSGLILKLNREPLPTLKPEVIERDRKYWESRLSTMIGIWLTEDTSVKEVTDYAEKVFLDKNLQGFKGEAGLVQTEGACKAYSKLRSSIAGLYAWRLGNTKEMSPEDRQRMEKAADYAFRQSFALCPWSSEAVFRYINLLVMRNRLDEAILIAQTALEIAAERKETNASQLKDLLRHLKQLNGQKRER